MLPASDFTFHISQLYRLSQSSCSQLSFHRPLSQCDRALLYQNYAFNEKYDPPVEELHVYATEVRISHQHS